MNPEFAEYVHPRHFGAFLDAARTFNCYILVRRTGPSAIQWVGREGYTGKRADLKAKTANRNVGEYRTAGLVCSPFLQPGAFTAERLEEALARWPRHGCLITVPTDGRGFDDHVQPRCGTPYLVQTNRRHRHFGCVAWVDSGLLVPRYVHGDYDLYAIIPAGQRYDPARLSVEKRSLGPSVVPSGLGPLARAELTVPDHVGPLSFRVATFINNRVASMVASFPGALMVNHGEDVNLGAPSYEPVLAFMPRPERGMFARVLRSRAEHEALYGSV